MDKQSKNIDEEKPPSSNRKLHSAIRTPQTSSLRLLLKLTFAARITRFLTAVHKKGNWAKLMDYLNALHADHVVMECAHRPAEELAVFRDLRPEIGLGLGVVDVKSTEVESAEEIARAIERAATGRGGGAPRQTEQ